MSTLNKLHQAHKERQQKIDSQAKQDIGINLRPRPKWWFGPAESFVPPNVPPDIHKVVSVTMAHFGLTKADALGPCRKRKTSDAKFCAYFLAKEYTGRSWSSLGRYFNKDHSTILMGLRRFATRPDLINEVGKIRRKLGSPK